jgi:hypothetical protein
MNFISADINLALYLALMFKLSLPYNSTGRARVEYNFILVFFLTLLDLKMLLIIPVIFRNVYISLSISFLFSYNTKVRTYLNIFTCSVLLLSITILLNFGSLPRNAITSDFSTEIFIP